MIKVIFLINLDRALLTECTQKVPPLQCGLFSYVTLAILASYFLELYGLLWLDNTAANAMLC